MEQLGVKGSAVDAGDPVDGADEGYAGSWQRGCPRRILMATRGRNMHAEDRLIHFSTELLHPPAPHAKAQLQKLYFDLAQARIGYDSISLSPGAPPRFHSRRGTRTQSVAAFMPDRIALVEEWVDIPLSEFLARVREMAARVFDTLGIAAFPAQVVTLRSTFALTHFTDARVFLLDHACGLEGKIAAHFGRPVGIGGLRFVLPQTPDHPGDLHVSVESFRHSQNEVLVEVKGVFNHPPITRENAETACANIERVRAFITGHVFPFLDQYDLAP